MPTIGVDEAGEGLADAIARVREEKSALYLEDNGRACAALVTIEDLELLERIKAGRLPGASTGALFEKVSDMAKLGYWEWDALAERCTRCSQGVGNLLGVTADEFVRRTNSLEARFEVVHPDDRERVRAVIAESRRDGVGYDVEYRLRREDGGLRGVREVGEPSFDESGGLAGWVGFIQDIGERKAVEHERRDRESLLRSVYTHMPGAAYRRVLHRDGPVSYQFISSGVRGLFGFDADEIFADPAKLTDNIHPHDREKRARAIERSARTLERYDLEYRYTLPSGEMVWIRAIADPERLDNGDVVWTGLTLDITDLKRLEEELRQSRDALEQRVRERTAELRQANDALRREVDERREAEASLRESEQRFRGFLDNLPVSILLKDPEGRYRLVNRRFCERYGTISSSVLGRTDHDLHPVAVADRYAVQDQAVLDSGEVRENRFTVPFSDGSEHIVEVTKFPVTGAMGETVGIGSISVDVTEREKVLAALRESEERLRVVTDNLPALIAYVDTDERYRFANRQCCEWYARPLEEILGKRIADIHTGAYDKFADRLRQVMEGAAIEFEDRITYPDGVVRDTRATWLPHFSDDGSLEGVFSLVEDMTEFRQAEERARQSQKMEAVGQLTGGVAHDFNNLLAVIIGNAEMLVEDFGEDDPSPKAILRAARRGTELTQRLLAFSRRQPLDPQSIDLVELVNGVSAMLKRTLGEMIEIAASGETGLWPAMADPGQVENALLNLAINARDAMPGGGKLTVECMNARLDETYATRTADAAPGDYAVLAVSDTGSGMSPEILEHVFEPFFTTKEVGQGTGLGLSMIYGFAKQSGGHVAIYSEVGMGTTVKLFLPRAVSGAEEDASPGKAEFPRGRGETVLVLEDDPDVRELAAKILGDLGYRVIEAGEACSAAAALAAADGVDLLLSDVILPGKMNGPDFAREARKIRPALKVMFMSGYPADAARNNGLADLGGPLLQKPLDRRQLAESLRAALDE